VRLFHEFGLDRTRRRKCVLLLLLVAAADREFVKEAGVVESGESESSPRSVKERLLGFVSNGIDR
jgi:hypothetical protein